MPIYEYKCKSCGEKFELRLSFFYNKKSVKCPKCGMEDPERVLSPFATDSYSGSSGESCSTRKFG